MKKIIAIGGGEIGRPGTNIETMSIDKEIIRLTNKKEPRLLFIPTASADSESYCEVIKNYFGKKLNCRVDALFLINKKISTKEIQNKILQSDIIYVGGGNTLRMLETWKEKKIGDILKKAYNKGIVLSGLSAGAICWFKFGNSDSLKFKNKKNPLTEVEGLGFINALFCPHYDVEKNRRLSLKKMLKNKKNIGLALENCVAIEIVDSRYRILSSKKNANAYKVFWNEGVYFEVKIPQKKEFLPIDDLLKVK